MSDTAYRFYGRMGSGRQLAGGDDMPSGARPGRKGLYVDCPEDLLAELKAFADSFPIGGIGQHVVWALRRHLADPPVLAAPPLTAAVPPPPPPRPRGRPKKKS
jgi:hypothetical protein